MRGILRKMLAGLVAILAFLPGCGFLEVRDEPDMALICHGVRSAGCQAGRDLVTAEVLDGAGYRKLVDGLNRLNEGLSADDTTDVVVSLVEGMLTENRLGTYAVAALTIFKGQMKVLSPGAVLGKNGVRLVRALCEGLVSGLGQD